ncbi:MAG: tetratricopeptide repeat protein [Candidatus Omnitrophota bacterium]
MTKSLLTVVFVFTLTTLAFADYDAGLSAYKRGDFATASREWRPLAGKGNAKAQNAIGVMYAKGEGFPQDYTKAIKWYRKAAKGGYLAAMRNLGGMYASGEGVTQNLGEASKWYRAAAEQGDHAARHKIAQFYAEGKGVPQDDIQAYTWLLVLDCKHPGTLEQRQAIAARLTAEQITAAKKNAAEWKAKK